MRKLAGWMVVLVVLLVTGCGGGSSDQGESTPAAAVAPGLKAVEVRDADGEMVMRHEFIVDSASQETVMTAQAAGLDAVWGTADDVVTARTVCTYTEGDSIDARLLQGDFFRLEQLADVSPGACLLTRPFRGKVDVALTGGALSSEALAMLLSAGSSPTGQILLDLLGWPGLLGMNSGEKSFSFMSVAEGIRYCDPDCAYLSDESMVSADAECNVNCTGINNTVYNPYEGVGSGVGYWQHPTYAGMQFIPSYAGGLLQRFSYSSDLQNPLMNVDGYQSFQFAGDGSLSLIESFSGKGTDLHWYTADDVVKSRLLQQKTSSGTNRIRYVAAGDDGVLKTGDDVIGSVVTLHEQAGKPLELMVCSASGDDSVWQTVDDDCQTLTMIY